MKSPLRRIPLPLRYWKYSQPAASATTTSPMCSQPLAHFFAEASGLPKYSTLNGVPSMGWNSSSPGSPGAQSLPASSTMRWRRLGTGLPMLPTGPMPSGLMVSPPSAAP
ncbi:hypothetical protein D9M73_276270 [compost metagenome]